MRPDPTTWGFQANTKPREGFFGEPISAALCGIAFVLAAIAIPGRLVLSLVMELVR